MEKASHLGQVRAAGVFTSRYAVLGIATASIPAAPRSNHVAVSQIHSRLGKVRSTPIATAETAKGTSSNAVDIEVRRRRSIMAAVVLDGRTIAASGAIGVASRGPRVRTRCKRDRL